MRIRPYLAILLLLFIQLTYAETVKLPIIYLTSGVHKIEAEVASTQENRATGLMYRKQLPKNRGMLFVFDNKQAYCMWMKNTNIPLSVAFMDETGLILNIEDMKPHTETSHCAAKPALYALEMNLGWVKKRGIHQGMVLDQVQPSKPQ